MNKERAIFTKNKILDLKDDLDHEECVEHDWLAVNKLNWEIEGFKEVLDILTDNTVDEHNNAKDFIWDKISAIEDSILYEEDRVKKYMFKCDLEEYNNIKDCLLAIGGEKDEA